MQDYIPRSIDINDKIAEITVKQFDNNSRFLHVQFTDVDLAEDENAFDLENCSVSLYIEPEGNTDPSEIAYIDGTVESAENGVMTFLIPGSVTQNVGRYKCEIHINEGDTTTYPAISSKPFFMTVEETIRDDQAIMASARFSALDKWASDVKSLNARMDMIEAQADAGEIPAGTFESEVIGIRTGVDGTTYGSAGAAVREQIKNVWNNLDNLGVYDNGTTYSNIDVTTHRVWVSYPIRNVNSTFHYIIKNKSTTDILFFRVTSANTPYATISGDSVVVKGIENIPEGSTSAEGTFSLTSAEITDAKYLVVTSKTADVQISFDVEIWIENSIAYDVKNILNCIGADGEPW